MKLVSRARFDTQKGGNAKETSDFPPLPPPVFVVLRMLAFIIVRHYVVALHFAWWEEK